MNSDVDDCVESDERILNVDLPDDTLERAAGSVEARRLRGYIAPTFGTIAGGHSNLGPFDRCHNE